MSDLVSAVPPHEPSEDALAFAGKAALSAFPIFGPMAAEALGHALDTRQSQRQHDFNLQIAYALTGALERLDASLTIEDIVANDEFVAAVTRAQRVASETASAKKRERLATAAVNGGGWAPFSASEREQFTRLVEEFHDLHVFLLHFYTDPKGWLDAHDMQDAYTGIYMASASAPLSAVLGASEQEWSAPVTQAASDLSRNGLADIPLRTIMSADGVIAARTSEKGRRLLAFLNEPSSASVDAPVL
jgi:hypothetical protein